MAGPTASPVPSETAPAVPSNGNESSTLVWSKVWNVESPAPTNTLKGSIVPPVLALRHKKRRVSLEVHRFQSVGGKTGPNAVEGVDYYEDCIIRILLKDPSKEGKEARRRAKLASQTRSGAASVLESVVHDDESDDGSVTIMEFADTGKEDSPNYAGWKAKYRVPVGALKITHVHRKKIVCVAQVGALKHNRSFFFHSEEEAKEFSQMVETQKQAEERRAAAKLKANLGTDKVALGKELTILVEIVSAWDLPIADISATGKGASDPFVQCYLNGKEVHRTKHISNNLDPIWTVKTDSLFLLCCTVGQMFSGEGLVCEVKDYDQFGKNDKLGAVTVSPKELYEGVGERKEYKLKMAQGQAMDFGTGMLAIRCRHASEYDIAFVESLKDDDKKGVLGFSGISKSAIKSKGGKGNIRSVISRTQKVERIGNMKVKKYHARPGPDPKRKDQTTWMTAEEVEQEVERESFHWFDTGSGNLGRLYVEVLGCDGLPNLDTGGFLGNKTDAFVAVVFEDTMMKTDVIDDCLNPRWLPWSKRGFIFHLLHPSSQLFLGVFDFDSGLDDHDLIGRVAVELTNLRPNLVYTLKYDIFPSAEMTERQQQGSITIRLRLEVDDERKLLLAALEPPPEIYVNVKKKKDFRVMRYTCQGKYDMNAYNMKVINSYVEELMTYQNLLYYVKDAFLHVLLWKGHFPIKLGKYVVKLPLHSMNTFLLGVVLVERPQLMPSFFFASIALLLLAVMGWRRNIPNPWNECKSFEELSKTLVAGHPLAPPKSIKAFENAEAAAAFEAWRVKRIEDAEAAAKVAYEESLKQQEEEMKELEEVGGTDTDISTKTGGGLSFDVFKPFLYPIQQYLGAACGYVRIVRHTVLWTECYLAFWITVGCVVLSVACFFVPWFFLIKWGSRIVVWTLLGPWMKLVDVFYVSKIKPPTEDEKKVQKMALEKARRRKLDLAVSEARVKRENANKLKDMKKIMFGKFITKVPVLQQNRHRDIPRPESSAVSYHPKPLGLAELAMKEAGHNRTRVPGQHLVGEMIPRIENKSFTDAPTGQPTKHPQLLDQSTAAASIKKDSDAVAYAKIGSIVVGAGVITWFGVPFLTSGAGYLRELIGGS